MRAIRHALIATSAILLFGCSWRPPIFTPRPSVAPAVEPPQAIAGTAQRASQASHLDAYKIDVAQHILASNAGRTFSGQLPPMLPAVVIVNISLDDNGNVTRAVVQRSRDQEASSVVIASILRSAPYPKPARLLRGGSKLLEFSETFLFNADYRFQLRSLAGPQ